MSPTQSGNDLTTSPSRTLWFKRGVDISSGSEDTATFAYNMGFNGGKTPRRSLPGRYASGTKGSGMMNRSPPGWLRTGVSGERISRAVQKMRPREGPSDFPVLV